MDSEDIDVIPSAAEEKRENSTLKIIFDIYLNPSAAFEALAAKPRWFIPFILCAFTAVVFMITINDIRLEDMKNELLINKTLGQDEINRRVENLTSQQQGDLTNMHIPSFLMGVGLITAGYSFKLFGLTTIIWLVLHLYKSKVDYKSVLALCSFAFIITIPEAVVNIPLMLIKGTMKTYMSPALLLPNNWEYSPLFNLAKALDIFSIWMVVLLMIGIPIIAGVSKSKAVIMVGCLWAGWLLYSMFFGNFIRII